ncbi:MAG: acyltransferase [Burkholderiales bacterium]|uniref:acyltransferase family protein n=1 Tax=Roseateles sp. TaxID=1971397 RepID=UPI000FBAB644|nr:MAG: acyltransferase [Burkholderiales bacterium]
MNSQSLADPGQLNADRLRFLDIARGLAVLGVIAVHTVQQFPTNVRPLDWWLGLGQFGVQLFFVISAYTMCMTLAARRHTERRPFIAFIVRRFCRLAIPMWAAMFLYSLFLIFDIPYFASKSLDGWVILLNAAMLSALSPTAFGVCVPGSGSIATEALFYLVFPMLFGMRRSPVALSVTCIASVLADYFLFRPAVLFIVDLSGGADSHVLNQYFLYGLNKQLPVFLAGMLLFAFYDRECEFKLTEWMWIAAATVFFGLFSGFIAIVAVVSWLVAYALRRSGFGSEVIGWLGRHSYSIYLFHFAALNLFLMAIPQAQRSGLFPFCFVACVALTAAAARFTKVWLEDAGTQLGRALVVRWKLA